MLEKPDIQDEKVIACLQDEYGLPVAQFEFLPLGADQNTAVYRAVTEDERPFFVKLRGGVFDEFSVELPKFLSDQGLKQIISIYPTRTGKLWANLEAFKILLYPFVVGQDGYEINLSDRQWRDFGAVLRRIHTLELPESLTRDLKQETYSPKWREMVKSFLARVENDSFDEPVAQRLAAFLKAKREETLDLVKRAEWHAQALQARSLEFVLCHADIHAGNILIDANDDLYIVDWDNPILAPKERDLMSIGAGLMGRWRTPQEEEVLFYQGYGPTQIEPSALAYYRYERIIEDIAIYCEELLLTNEGGEDREQSLKYLKSNFLPDHTIEIACRADKILNME